MRKIPWLKKNYYFCRLKIGTSSCRELPASTISTNFCRIYLQEHQLKLLNVMYFTGLLFGGSIVLYYQLL